MEYTELLIEADEENLITKEKPLRANEGRIKGNRIAIKKDLPETRKKCVLAEELGHHYTTSGDILEQNCTSEIKQELHAREWAYDHLIGLNGIVKCYEYGCKDLYEAANLLDVTEDFMKDALTYYQSKYGMYCNYKEYIVYFMPTLGVLKII